MAIGFSKSHGTKYLAVCLTFCLLTLGVIFANQAQGDTVDNRYLQLSDALPGDTSNYIVGFDLATTQNLGSIQVQFCSNSPLIRQSCTTPGGFDLSSATLSGQTGVTDFSISPLTTTNNLILTRTPSVVTTPISLVYSLSGVTNPSSAGPYFARITTYPTQDASGAYTDWGGLAYSITNNISISATVPPYIDICVGLTITNYDCNTATGNYINLGDLSSNDPSAATSQVVIAANAANGYSLWATGNSLTSGNNVIPGINSDDIARPGTAQFGINLAGNNTPRIGANVNGPGIGVPTPQYGQPDFFKYVPDDVIATSSGPADFNNYTVSYLVDIQKSQAPGVYSTTLTYMALGNF